MAQDRPDEFDRLYPTERAEASDSGVAKSSRSGMKRSVNAGPTRRAGVSWMLRVPRIHTLRNPFFNRTLAIVAVVRA